MEPHGRPYSHRHLVHQRQECSYPEPACFKVKELWHFIAMRRAATAKIVGWGWLRPHDRKKIEVWGSKLPIQNLGGRSELYGTKNPFIIWFQNREFWRAYAQALLYFLDLCHVSFSGNIVISSVFRYHFSKFSLESLMIPKASQSVLHTKIIFILKHLF